jgi:hypothetical protein
MIARSVSTPSLRNLKPPARLHAQPYKAVYWAVLSLTLVAVTGELLTRFCGEWTWVFPILPLDQPRATYEKIDRQEKERKRPSHLLHSSLFCRMRPRNASSSAATKVPMWWSFA